jgi:curved DNA-binding protein
VKDYYNILGVDRSASEDDIKRAYRKQAMKHHPDRGGDEAKFKEIEEAYRILSDTNQRQQYDNPGVRIDIRDFSGSPFDFDSIFNMFGAQFRGNPQGARFTQTARVQLWLTLQDVIQGGRRLVGLNTQNGNYEVEIDIPVGIEDGANVRYEKLGPNNSDLVVLFRIRPDPVWHRDGRDLHMIREVSIWDMVLGADLTVTDLTGKPYHVTIPELTQIGTKLRMKGLGLPDRMGNRGNLYVQIAPKMPTQISDELKSLLDKERTGK